MEFIECVPNFSEGRDQAVIDAIAASIRSVADVQLLHIDPDRSTHRTVMTFAGPGEAVAEAAFRGARTAFQRIDMARHAGAHPRMGAVDVVPFVPLAGAGMERCIELARGFGRRVGEELGVPVYLYEEAQPEEHRRQLSQVRRGGYEGLRDRVALEQWRPDFGPAKFVARSGAMATGARFLLIAYNINVRGTVEQARRMAARIRESGRLVVAEDGSRAREPGLLRTVKAIGWELEEHGVVQVSTNLTDFRVASLHHVYDAVRDQAEGMGLSVAGSEVVGMVPLKPLVAAGTYYAREEGRQPADPRDAVRLAIDRLGLSSLHPFRPEEKILEYAMGVDHALEPGSPDGA